MLGFAFITKANVPTKIWRIALTLVTFTALPKTYKSTYNFRTKKTSSNFGTKIQKLKLDFLTKLTF